MPGGEEYSFEKFISIIGENAENQDEEEILQNVLKYVAQSKEETGQDEDELLKKMLDDLNSLSRPQATFYEYLLFFAVTAFIVSIFGEKYVLDSEEENL